MRTRARNPRRRVLVNSSTVVAVLGFLGLGLLVPAVPVRAQTAPSGGPAPVALTQIATAEQPIGVVLRANDRAMYVLEKVGRVRALDGASWRSPAVLDIRARVSTQNERGLIGLAFSLVNPAVLYATYTIADGTIVVSEFAFDGTSADIASERVLLRVPHPNDDHNGGTLAVDREGFLWIGLGDGGGVGTRGGIGDKANNAQNLNVLYGKILRIDPQTRTGDLPYGIPPSNPYANGSSGTIGSSKPARREIVHYGLRNPWRLLLSANGDLWVPDIGQASWEEINRVPLTRMAANFGWRLREGTKPYRGAAKPKGAVDPVHEFAHTNGRCAVIGGAAPASGPWSTTGARGGLIGRAEVRRVYYFGDLCSGRFTQLVETESGMTTKDLGNRLAYLTSVNEGPDGALIVTSLNGGVYRLE